MAEYIDLRRLFTDAELGNKVDVAMIIAANDLLSATPSPAEQKWASQVASNPRAEGKKALMFVIAQNKDATIEQIRLADDASIQTAVDSVVPALVAAAE